MITEEQVKTILEAKAEEEGHFVVTVKVGAGNRILVEMDNMNGFGIADCKAMSRHLESTLDRELEDFSLELSTPGLGNPLKVHQQYLKNVGRKVEVITLEGKTLKGELLSATPDKIEVLSKERVRVEKKKSKKTVETTHALQLDQVKETKVAIEFK